MSINDDDIIIHAPSSGAELGTYISVQEDDGEEREGLLGSKKDPGHDAKSSFVQTVFNLINLLMGVSLIGLPFAMKVSGWAVGLTVIGVLAVATHYTARTLIHCMKAHNLKSYNDIGAQAFGRKGETFIGSVMFMELFTACITYLIIAGDNLEKLNPILSAQEWMCVMAAVVLPSVWLRSLSWLSYISVLGLISCVFLLGVVIAEGVKAGAAVPGSLVVPAPTAMVEWSTAPYALGLVMCGFAGHPVVPAIYTDMKQKQRYTTALVLAYIVVIAMYVGMAAVGYVMYGTDCTEREITLNLIPGPLTMVAVGLVVAVPPCKYALTLMPVVMSVEDLFKHKLSKLKFFIVSITLRTVLTGLTLLLAVFIPHFDRVVAFCGSFFSFTVSILFPAMCYIKLFWRKMPLWEKVANVAMFVLGLACIIAGTTSVIIVHPDMPDPDMCVQRPLNATPAASPY